MENTYKEKILSLINEATEPLDIEKIREACGIGNWNTALKHCLELVLENKISGVKTSKSWVFWIGSEKILIHSAEEKH
jgi:predicted Zn-ribbon and HTH transcriptional regulator